MPACPWSASTRTTRVVERPQRRPVARRRPRPVTTSQPCSRTASWPRHRRRRRLAARRHAVICVPTPLSDGRRPRPGRGQLGGRDGRPSSLRPGTLVVLESTTYPGTTEEVVRPLLERRSGLRAGMDFHLAFSPERIDPGNPTFGIAQHARRSSAASRRRARTRAAAFYGRFVDTVVRAARHPRGRDGQAAGEHLPAREHRAGQRDGEVLPRARHRPVGRRSAARPPSRSASRPSTPARASAVTASRSTPTTSPTRCGSARLPVPVRRAGPGDQRRMPGYVVPRGQDLLNRNDKPLNGSTRAAARRHLQEGHRRSAGVAGQSMARQLGGPAPGWRTTTRT